MNTREETKEIGVAKTINVVLVGGEPIIRQGLKQIMEKEADIKYYDEWDGPKGEFNPDAVIFYPPTSNEEESFINEIVELARMSNVVVLSDLSNEAHFYGALKAGAKAFLPKSITGDELIQAIRAVIKGNRYLASPFLDIVINVYVGTPGGSLTRREREVMELVFRHMTSAQIATRLGISRRTVEVYRLKLRQKKGLKGNHKRF